MNGYDMPVQQVYPDEQRRSLSFLYKTEVYTCELDCC